MNHCGVRVREVSYHAVRVRTRMPFRYGIAELREMPHLFVRVGVEVGGKMVVGVGADNLPPKWFTKDPGTTYEEDLREMGEVIRGAGRFAVEVGERGSVFEWWREVYGAQRAWGEARGVPGLLWGFGVSLLERAVMDAFCRGEGVAFGEALRSGRLGLVDAGELRAELRGVKVAELLPGESRGSVAVRHTVGLSDPLVTEDVEERIEDGLPQTLEEVIAAYGVRYFKIKLAGDVGRDGERLRRLAELLERVAPDYGYTLDGNENFRELSAFRELWDSLSREAGLRRFLSRLIFVEQPLHREVALSEGVGRELRAWPGRPAMIIDESDGEMGSLPAALAAGYVGTSHKNCKGVLKGVGNYCLLEMRRREEPRAGYVLSGEDLTNIGPVALMQDLAVLGALGVAHAERNGQHYVRGLEAFPREVQEAVVAGHPDLYQWQERGYATVRIADGMVSTRSASGAPFGYGMEFDPKVFPEWEG